MGVLAITDNKKDIEVFDTSVLSQVEARIKCSPLFLLKTRGGRGCSMIGPSWFFNVHCCVSEASQQPTSTLTGRVVYVQEGSQPRSRLLSRGC